MQKKRVVGERDRAEALRAEQRAAVLNMKAELERMEQKQEELAARKNTLGAQLKQARAGGTEVGGARGGTSAFAEFKRMEDAVENQVAEVSAHREVEEALKKDGLSREELEAKFARLEGGGRADEPGKPGSPDIDDELAQLKKKIRIG